MPHIYRWDGESFDAPIRPFLAIPCYGDMPASLTFSLWASHYAFNVAGIPVALCILEGNCHVDDSRNVLVRDFLESKCTDLIFIDADVGWNADDLVTLARADRDIVAGIYPLKQEEEGFPVRVIEGILQADPDGCVEVEGVPTGFLKIRREVLEKLHSGSRKFWGQKDTNDRKPIGLIFERELIDGERLGGDYNFCRKARIAGYKIHVLPDMQFSHIGQNKWSGSLGDYWKREHGVTEQLFNRALMAIRDGEETDQDIENLCKHWGNIPWSAGAGLVKTWIELARQAKGSILECGSGLTTICAAFANPDVTVYALDNDPGYGGRIQGLADSYGLENVKIVHAPLKDGWYDIPEGAVLYNPDLILVDGPRRDINDMDGRFKIERAGFTWNTIVFDDLDHDWMVERVKDFATAHDSVAEIIEHPTKNFAIIRKAA